ncbi:tyrosine-type recombinase/integrase [Oleiharenicola lentus]|nr:tyrosine-type recombinase/integrase [Oleiharenicola lentus]
MNRCDCPSELDEVRLEPVLAAAVPRDRLLVVLGLETGLRISELVGLKVGEVWQADSPVRVLRLTRARLKGGAGLRARAVSGRQIPLNARAGAILREVLGESSHLPREALFPSRQGAGRAITRQQALRVIKKIFLLAGCDPSRVWGGHSLRRRFVRRVFDRTRDINVARAAVGHRWIATTQAYLDLAGEAAEAAILAIGEVPPAVAGESCPRRAG